MSALDFGARRAGLRALSLTGMVLGAAVMAVTLARPALAAEPVRIGVTSVLSGPAADRGQSEQYAIELALQRVNRGGGVLGRPVEAFYADHGADPQAGVAAAKRLIEQQHVSVVIGALLTPVTRAVMPVMQEAKVPFVIDISAGQEFVDAAGVGGNDFVFKTCPSDLDVATAVMRRLKAQGVHSVALVVDDADFNRANQAATERAAAAAGVKIVANELVPKGTKDLSEILARLDAARPERIVSLLGASSAAFFRAYPASAGIPLAGRIDFAAALANLPPPFVSAGGLAQAESVTVFNGLIESAEVQAFIRTYRDKYGFVPNQRAFFAYEATLLVTDAIQRAGSDAPMDVQRALKSSKMPSLLGGTYAMDEHNHSHTALQLVGVRSGKAAVIGSAGT